MYIKCIVLHLQQKQQLKTTIMKITDTKTGQWVKFNSNSVETYEVISLDAVSTTLKSLYTGIVSEFRNTVNKRGGIHTRTVEVVTWY